jgi:plasmid stability protein
MSDLLIKDLPPELHHKLKEEAARHHRSMSLHALMLLEQALTSHARNAANLLRKPLKLTKQVVSGDVASVIRRCRDTDKAPPPK